MTFYGGWIIKNIEWLIIFANSFTIFFGYLMHKKLCNKYFFFFNFSISIYNFIQFVTVFAAGVSFPLFRPKLLVCVSDSADILFSNLMLIHTYSQN